MGSLQGSRASSAVNHMAIPELTPLPVLCGCLCARHWLKALTKRFFFFFLSHVLSEKGASDLREGTL